MTLQFSVARDSDAMTLAVLTQVFCNLLLVDEAHWHAILRWPRLQ